MRLWKIKYTDLNPKQKEIFNFQKLAGQLADYGFNCIKLSDDWQGADFIAYHKDGDTTLKVQLKSRVVISKEYCGKGLYIAFPIKNNWYLLEHDRLVKLIEENTNWLNTSSWRNGGRYSSAGSQKLSQVLEAAKIPKL